MMTTAKRRLKNIKTFEVSLVDKAANKREFLVMKAAEPIEKESESVADLFTKIFRVQMTLPEIMRHTQFMSTDEMNLFFAKIEKSEPMKDLLSELTKLDSEALKKSLKPLLKSETIEDFVSVLKTDMPSDFMDRRIEDFETDVNKLGREALEIARTMVNMLNDFFNRGVKPSDSTFISEEPPMVEKSLTKEEISKLPQNAQDYIAAMEESHQSQLNQAKEETAEVQKSLDEVNAKLVAIDKSQDQDPYAGMTAIQKAATQKMEKKIAMLEKAADQAETKEYITKAADLNLPEVDADVFGPVLKEVNAKCSKETSEAVMKALTDAGDVIKKADLLKSVGADGEPVAGNENEAAIESAAQEIMKSENCSYAVAVTKALELNPSLYQ